jgi:hypothetical protein
LYTDSTGASSALSGQPRSRATSCRRPVIVGIDAEKLSAHLELADEQRLPPTLERLTAVGQQVIQRRVLLLLRICL